MAKRSTKRVTKQTAESPTSSCLIFCENVTISLVNNLHTLHGVITEMVMPDLPSFTGAGMVYMRLRNLYANQQFSLKFKRLDTLDTLFEFAAQSGSNADPLGNHIIILRIPPFEMPESGRYAFSAEHGDKIFAECVINVVSAEQLERS